MKKKNIILALSVAAVLVATIGVGAAINLTDGDTSVNLEISEKNLSVAANQAEFDNEVSVIPGKAIDLHYTLENDGLTDAGEAGYDIYAKVDVFFNFEKEEKDGTVSVLNWSENYKDFVEFTMNDGKSQVVLNKKINSVKDAYKIGDWIITYYDDEQLTMYYTKPLAYGDISTEFLSTVSFNKSMGNEFAETKFNIETEVTAVQTISGESAMAAEWGVFPTIDEDGVITKVSENR